MEIMTVKELKEKLENVDENSTVWIFIDDEEHKVSEVYETKGKLHIGYEKK